MAVKHKRVATIAADPSAHINTDHWNEGHTGEVENAIPYVGASPDFLLQESTNLTFNGTSLVVGTAGPHAYGGAVNTQQRLRLTGSFAASGSGAANALIALSGSLTPAGSHSSNGLFFDSITLNVNASQIARLLYVAGTLNKASSGTHTRFASVEIDPPTVAGGAGTVTTAVSLYVSSAPTGATNNYALHIASGVSRFDGAQIQNSDGTVGSPSYSFGSSTGTGIYRPAATTLGFVTNAVERMSITSTGVVQMSNILRFNGDGAFTTSDEEIGRRTAGALTLASRGSIELFADTNNNDTASSTALVLHSKVAVGSSGITFIVRQNGQVGINGDTVSNQLVTIGGSFSGSGVRIAPTLTGTGVGSVHSINVVPSLNPAVNDDAYGVNFSPSIIEAASGTHALIAGLRINVGTITNGAATTTTAAGIHLVSLTAASGTTNAAMLSIAAAPTGATNNMSIWVAAGNTCLGSVPTTGLEPFTITLPGTAGATVKLEHASTPVGYAVYSTHASWTNPFTSAFPSNFPGAALHAKFVGGIRPWSMVSGGFSILGSTSAAGNPAISVEAAKGTASSSIAAIQITASLSDGAGGVTAFSGTDRILTVRNNTDAMFSLLGSGRLVLGSGTNLPPIPVASGITDTVDLGVIKTSSGSRAIIGAYVYDGTNNRRIGLFVNDSEGVWGLGHSWSANGAPFIIAFGTSERLRMQTSGELALTATSTIAASASAYGLDISPAFTEAGSGTHALIAGLRINVGTITNGAATTTTAAGIHLVSLTAASGTTNAAMLSIAAAPTGATNNMSIWVAAGNTCLGSVPTTGLEPFTITLPGTAGATVKLEHASTPVGYAVYSTHASWTNPFTSAFPSNFPGAALHAKFVGGIRPWSMVSGGFSILGSTSAAGNPAISVEAAKGTASSSIAAIQITASLSDGAGGVTAFSGTDRILTVRNNTDAMFSLLGSGRLVLGSGTNLPPIPVASGITDTVDLGVIKTSSGSRAIIGAYVYDGTNNRRIGLFVNDSEGVWGLGHSWSANGAPFIIAFGTSERLRMQTSGELALTATSTIAASASAYGLDISPAFTEAGSGTHPEIAGLRVNLGTITNGAATTTTAAGISVPTFTAATGTTNAIGLRILGQPTGATNNYAMLIEAGRSRFNGQIGVNTDPATSALLDLSSTTGALLVPRMTTTQRNALTAVNGMILYDTTALSLYGRINGHWFNLNSHPGHSVKGLSGANNSTTPNTQYDFSADVVTLRNPTNNEAIVAFSVGPITCNVSTAGPAANGRDQSGSFSANSWIHFWFITNGTIVATLASLAAVSPTLPSGYTHRAYIGAVRFNASSQLVRTRMNGSWCSYDTNINVFSSTTQSTTETSISLSSAIPPNTLNFKATCGGQFVASSGGVLSFDVILRHVTGLDHILSTITTVANGRQGLGFQATFPHSTTQTMYIIFSNTTNLSTHNVAISVQSYQVPNGGE